MALDRDYARRLEHFIKTVISMQNEVEFGTILDSNNKARYEEKMKMSIADAYKTTLKLYKIANNGRFDDFSSYFADISAILVGFEKQPFKEIIEKSGVKVVPLEEIAKNSEKIMQKENSSKKEDEIEKSTPKIIRNSYFENFSKNNENKSSSKNENMKIENMKIKITNDIDFFGYAQNNAKNQGGKK